MPTRKKGGAKKTIGTKPRGRKPKSDDTLAVNLPVNSNTNAFATVDDVFNDIMLLLDGVDPISRTEILAKVTNTLLESKKHALEKAQQDYEMLNKFVSAYSAITPDSNEKTAEAAPEETQAVPATSKWD